MLRIVTECHILHAAPAEHGLGSTHQAGQGQLTELAHHAVAQSVTNAQLIPQPQHWTNKTNRNMQPASWLQQQHSAAARCTPFGCSACRPAHRSSSFLRQGMDFAVGSRRSNTRTVRSSQAVASDSPSGDQDRPVTCTHCKREARFVWGLMKWWPATRRRGTRTGPSTACRRRAAQGQACWHLETAALELVGRKLLVVGAHASSVLPTAAANRLPRRCGRAAQ